MSKTINCPICGLNNSKFLFKIDRFNNTYSIVNCKDCGLLYVNPQPTEQELVKHYSKNYNYSYMQQNKESGKDRDDSKEISNIKKGILLDVGCGSGLFLLAARKHGFIVRGVDLSTKMTKYGKNRFGLDLSNRDFLELSKNKQFDVITMRHLLEHVTNPINFIRKSRELLKKDGLLFLEVPNIDSFPARICGKAWQWMTPPAHLFFFSPKTIKKLLEKESFRVIKSGTRKGDAAPLIFAILVSLISRLPLWEILKMRALKNSQRSTEKEDKRGTIQNLERKIIKTCSLLDIIFFPVTYVLNNFSGPEMVVYARKK